MSLKIYFLRHGETTYSKTGGFCGDLDPELTAEGSMMAEQFATAYAKLPWSAVYLSPMKRTIATAKPLCDTLGIEMQFRDGLKEIKYGEWEGKTLESVKQEYAEDYINWLTEPAWNAPNGGETSVQIASRVRINSCTSAKSLSRSGAVNPEASLSSIRVVNRTTLIPSNSTETIAGSGKLTDLGLPSPGNSPAVIMSTDTPVAASLNIFVVPANASIKPLPTRDDRNSSRPSAVISKFTS